MSGDCDVLIVGYGWAGSLMAAWLVRQGLSVTVLERGADLAMADCGHFHAPGQGRRPHERTQNAALETFTLRHAERERALPIRRMGSFLAGSGAGGGGVLWGGVSPRYAPESFTVPQRYRHAIAHDEELAGIAVRGWPIGYDDVEPWYAEFERLVGVAGDGRRTVGWRSGPYPLKPAQATQAAEIFRRAASDVGLAPASLPMAEIAEPYTNPLDVTRRPCEDFGTTLATPLNTVDPFARASGRLTLLTGAHVRRVEHDGRQVTGVRYVRDGQESVATAHRYVLATWALNNVRLLLLSRIGVPYDPGQDTGVVGRGLSGHLTLGAAGFFPGTTIDTSLKTSAGWVVSRYENRVVPSAVPYVGGAQLHCSNLELKPKADLLVPGGGKCWGPQWKEALRRYGRSSVRVIVTGEVVAHRARHADLDPVYRDAWGDPLLRLTYDWTANERRLARAIGGEARRILTSSGAAPIEVRDILTAHYDCATYQNSHLAGGALMGTSPADSATDPELRSWQLGNLWIAGSSGFPRNASPNPTPTVGALALRAAAAIARTLQPARTAGFTPGSGSSKGHPA
ncbi:MAG TPA: GMC family oxidoreductase [Streptosporangiaceae bacterium]|jgi:gluconate 2-dehydrogenase alpha chain